MGKHRHHVLGRCDILFQARTGCAMVAECRQGLRRHGVDRVPSDQFLDIDDIAIGRVLGAGAGPEQALHMSARITQSAPARSGENSLVILVGKLCVCDGDFPAQTGKRVRLASGREFFQMFVDQFVHGGVDAADEEAGDAG